MASVQMLVVPWLGGPARQFILRPAAGEPADVVPLRTASGPGLVEAVVSPQPAAPHAPTPAPVEVETPPPPSPPPAAVTPASPSAPDAELRAILDTVADGIITLDAKGLIHSFSAGAEAIFGYRIAEVIGKPLVELMAADSRKTVRDYLSALQGPGLASVFNDGREVNAVVKQGGTVPLFLTLGCLQAPRSSAAFCAVVRDITQWKKTEAELRDAKELAEATSRQKSEFLARISHELRTPLNAIMGFSEVMRLQRFGKIENDKYLGYANDIHASGSHLLSLINDLLDLSKVEAGKLELNFTSVGLGDVADHVIRMLQEEATAARVVMRKAMPADLPHVVADLRSMRQILLNLVSNALKFTDPGGQIIISAQLTPAGELKLRVKDTGIGMNEEQVRDALEPFRRVTTEGRDTPGTGLGLPLTKALAEANRAQFSISSEPRKGTLVEITFPTTRVLAG
jgi:PAS domain S-box-containing protein